MANEAPSETTKLNWLIAELKEQAFGEEVISAFKDAGLAMIDRGVTDAVGLLADIKSVMANEYGD